MLIKGLLIFLTLGLVLTFLIVGIEYFLWLETTWRLLLFIFLLGITLFLFYRYILIPLFYLFKIKKGISYKYASRLIGEHFPEVADKLYNLFDLTDSEVQSELLKASIEQRSKDLRIVPFVKAIDYKDVFKYGRYLIVPLLLLFAIYFSGNWSSFFNSYDRVLNYDLAYEAPAPFSFQLENNDLTALEDKSYTIRVKTKGNVRPDVVFIEIDGKQLILQKEDNGFTYTLTPPLRSTDFHFFSGKVRSKTYQLEVMEIPVIQNFEVHFDYPGYLKRDREVLKSTGNAILPEGTKVTWVVNGLNIDEVRLADNDTVWNFFKSKLDFKFSKSIYDSYNYQLSASNDNVKDYEILDYKFTVRKDAFPTIKVKQVLDSLNPNISYYVGESSDDYKLRTIGLICYMAAYPDSIQKIELVNPNANYNKFYYTFPSGLQLRKNVDYEFYFFAVDNDAINGSKTVKSQIFKSRLLNEDELMNKDLQNREAIIKNMNRSLNKLEEQDRELEEINKSQKKKKDFNFNDQNEIKDFLKKQEAQEHLMQNYSKQLQDNLKKTAGDNELNKLLQERLERQEIEARKNEKLLDELDKIADKIDKEELTKRLEELGKKQQNSKRNLEQLLELTKRYYVTEKIAQLARDLKKMADKQEELSNINLDKGKEADEQKSVNEDFDDFTKELEELIKDNEELQKPIDLDVDTKKEESIKEDQESVLDDLEKSKGEEPHGNEDDPTSNGTDAKQKSASDKMKEMSESLESSAAGASGGSTITEDAEMLRQIVDNLVIFSFKQENLFGALEEADVDISNFSKTIKDQNELRSLFEHVDDSLFALSLRRAELSELVNEQITEVYYNIDKSLESIAENHLYQGVSYQKYVLNASNVLADFLANILDNMQQSMQAGSGSGNGEPGFQLPDIIKGQGELKDKMEGKGASKKGESEGEGKENKSGKGKEGKDDGKGKLSGQDGEENNDNTKGEGTHGEGAEKGKGNSLGEEELKEIYEIYKQQQMLRNKLEEELKNMIQSNERKLGEKLIKQMEDFENDLLENGITKRTLDKVNNIEHELLKLEDASLTKGRKSVRESKSNENMFINPILTKPTILEDFKNNTEILNRQALPLRQNYQFKVKDYFEQND